MIHRTKTVLTCLTIFISAFSFARSTVTLDLTEVDFGQYSKPFISWEDNFPNVPKDKIIELKVKNLPTIAAIKVLDGKKIKTLRYIWIDSPEIRLSGSLDLAENITIQPNHDLQGNADKILIETGAGAKKISQDLLFSKPHLVHLEQLKQGYQVKYLKEVLASLPEDLEDFWAATEIQNYIKRLESVEYDHGKKQLTKLTLLDAEKTEKVVAPGGGKKLFIDFSSSGCGPCLRDIDKIVEMHKSLGDKVDMITVWSDNSFDIWQNASRKQKDKITWISLLDEGMVVYEAMKINGWPTYMLFDENGKLEKKWYKLPENLEKYL